ncbi:hypothetical protein SRB5_06110 [Streptomyces sp. RB5]|uniref:ATP-grasp domain-containing protein n=1 Tax=Streptomyces smaragdinus TaxID=2585196 RepID=A0A7K0CAU5_9ACTN|nr:STM4014 family protein [Streptomyces smaragdinus]MQY10503.1 hypothetical protein [Streptomyces smaragdinus]
MSAPRLTVVGNPENRRVRLYAEATARAGLPAPHVVPWLDVLTGAAPRVAGDVVRIDSPGENAAVDRILRGAAAPERVEGTARWYRRFLAAVRSVADAMDPGARLLTDPDDLAVVFDKRRCHAVLHAAGVPVPESPTSGGADPVRSWDDVRRTGLRRFFVKPAHGSSASGVLAVEAAGPGRVRATTSVELAPDGALFNSLRVRRYTDETQIGAIVDTLAPDGLHVERWFPKASRHGRAADLRVVVVAGRATHAVLRTSGSPMTNLHLGGTRGDLDAVRAAIGPERWAQALSVCERAAACFPRTLCVGVDLLPGIGWRRFAVGEVNAFGDLLPGLTGLAGGGAEGLDTYDAQVAAVLRGAYGETRRV